MPKKFQGENSKAAAARARKLDAAKQNEEERNRVITVNKENYYSNSYLLIFSRCI